MLVTMRITLDRQALPDVNIFAQGIVFKHGKLTMLPLQTQRSRLAYSSNSFAASKHR